MHKIITTLLLAVLLTGSAYATTTKPFGYDLNADIHRNRDKETNVTSTKDTSAITETKFYSDSTTAAWESEPSTYSNASLSSAIRKYKANNYSGCLQEMISLSKKDKSNPIIYYYMAMSYAQLGNKDQAVKAYETVLKLNPNETLSNYATIGRDCIVGGPACTTTSESSSFDNFVNSSYGNGFSNDLNKQLKEQQLRNIQKTINNKQELNDYDIERIQRFDSKSDASQTPTNEEVLAALETLKKAGITISVNPYQQAMPMDNQYAELNMLLGNRNNNNNSMMNMMPFLLSQSQNGKNLDPQIFQSMMMNSMIPDFTFDNDKKY